MQSGKAKTGYWVLEFEPEKPRKIDPLMGFTSSGDMRTQVRLSFPTREEAVAYAEREGIPYRIEEPKEVKRRREAAELYRKANREDLAAAEEAEAAILGEYLPRQLTAEELRPLVAAAIAELGGAGPADMGKVMPALMQRFKGQADGRVISQVAREVLTQKQ